MKIYILIDGEAPRKDCVESVHTTRENAEKAEKELKAMCVGGRFTHIIESRLNPTSDSKRPTTNSQEAEIDEYLNSYDPDEPDPEELDDHWTPNYFNL